MTGPPTDAAAPPSHGRAPRAPRGARPCDGGCGATVDPLRAAAVRLRSGAMRYFCGARCAEHAAASRPSARPAEQRAALARGARASVPAGPSSEPEGPPGAAPPQRVEDVAALLGLASEGAEEASAAPPSATSAGRDAVRAVQSALAPQRSARGEPLLAWGAAALGLAVAHGLSLSSPAALALCAPLLVVAVLLALRALWALRRLHGGPWLPWFAALAGALLRVAFGGVEPGQAPALVASTTALVALVATLALLARGALEAAAEAFAPLEERYARARGAELSAGEARLFSSGALVGADVEVLEGSARVRGPSSLARADERGVGAALLAGSAVLEGRVRCTALRASDDATLPRTLRAFARDEAPASLVRWVDRAALLLPAASALAAAVSARAQGVDGTGWMAVAGAALLASPGLLAPALARAPWRVAAARAASAGVLFRDGRALAQAAAVRAVTFCVRGTVTAGRPELVDVLSLGRLDDAELLSLAASAELAAGEHALARAVRDGARARGARVEPLRRPAWVAGRGVAGVSASGAMVRVGSRAHLLGEGVSVALAEAPALALEAQRRTALFVSVGERVEGVLGVEDAVRPEARAATQALMDLGVEVSLLDGDSRGALEALAATLDVLDVRPEVLPDERAATVRALRDVAERVAVVGLPTRDAAALAAADVAFALGPARSGLAPAAVLTSDELRALPRALSLARVGAWRAQRASLVALGGSLGCALLATLPGASTLALGGVALAAALASAYAALGAPSRGRGAQRSGVNVT